MTMKKALNHDPQFGSFGEPQGGQQMKLFQDDTLVEMPKDTPLRWIAWFDGACEPNPGGHASYGVAVHVDGKVALSVGEYVGLGEGMTSNVAEYCGVARVLRFVATIEGAGEIRGDSKLVMDQLTGRWKVKKGLYVPYFKAAAELLAGVRDRVRLVWIPREQNAFCDGLAGQVLAGRGVQASSARRPTLREEVGRAVEVDDASQRPSNH